MTETDRSELTQLLARIADTLESINDYLARQGTGTGYAEVEPPSDTTDRL